MGWLTSKRNEIWCNKNEQTDKVIWKWKQVNDDSKVSTLQTDEKWRENKKVRIFVFCYRKLFYQTIFTFKLFLMTFHIIILKNVFHELVAFIKWEKKDELKKSLSLNAKIIEKSNMDRNFYDDKATFLRYASVLWLDPFHFIYMFFSSYFYSHFLLHTWKIFCLKCRIFLEKVTRALNYTV